MDQKQYYKYMRGKEEMFESICKWCGECCGSLDDPCLNLEKTVDGTYFCKNYEGRFAPQRTLAGNTFNCVSIREHILKGSLRPDCAYRK
ncbi:MAG: hypothetical protein ABIA77_02320 [Candidatus Omnitrophota bacterium]